MTLSPDLLSTHASINGASQLVLRSSEAKPASTEK